MEKISKAKNNEGLFQRIDRKSIEIMHALAEAPLYKKTGSVNAYLARGGEKIETNLESGFKETEKTACEGDWIVTNPTGEKYLLSAQTFRERYEPTGDTTTYVAKGYCRAVANPFKKPIEIAASWGSLQTGDAYCFVADTCNKNGVTNGEPYLIDAHVFRETYREVFNTIST